MSSASRTNDNGCTGITTSSSSSGDTHAFESIDLNVDRETQKKLWKINEAAEQADLARFRHRMADALQETGADCNLNTGIHTEDHCAILGYGLPVNGDSRSRSSANGNGVLHANGASSSMLLSTNGHKPSTNGNRQSSTGTQTNGSASTSTSMAAFATDDMESSIAILTKEEFYGTATMSPNLLSSLSPTDSSSSSEVGSDKCIQTDGVKTFPRTHKALDLDKYLKRTTKDEDRTKNLLADAMIEYKKNATTSSPQVGFDRSFYNISGISDVDVVESEWSRIDGSPRKPLAPVNMSALLERTILQDGGDGAMTNAPVTEVVDDEDAELVVVDAAAVNRAAADPIDVNINEQFNISNDNNSTTSDEFVLIPRANTND